MTIAAPAGADPFGHKRPQKATTMQTSLSPIDLFTPAADVVTRTMQPQARAVAAAATLLEIALAARPDMRLDPQLMRQAYLTLSIPRSGDPPPVAARRSTCMEIADAIGAAHNLGPRPGPGDRAPIEDLARVLPWWATGVLLPGDDPRKAAIRDTAAREQRELELAVNDLDGRSGMLEITVADRALRPVASRRERPAVDPAVAAELALEALDSMARELRQEPANITRRQALEVNLHTALDRLQIETTGAIVDVITAALGLSMSEAAVVADVLISVKPALARACGLPSF